MEALFETMPSSSQHPHHSLFSPCFLGQVLYRLERYEDSIKEYERIMGASQDPSSDPDMEHATNLIAAMVGHEVALRAAGRAASTSEPPRGDGFETLCNTSCLLLARGRCEEALKAIDSAIADCREVCAMISICVPLATHTHTREDRTTLTPTPTPQPTIFFFSFFRCSQSRHVFLGCVVGPRSH